MIRTEFEYEGLSVVAYGNSTDGMNVEGMIIKVVDENGDRIFPHLSERQKEEMEELALEVLTNDVEELRF